VGSAVVFNAKVGKDRDDGGMGALEASLCTHECFNAPIIFLLEMCLEVDHGVLCCRFALPFVNCTVKNTGLDKESECQMHGCGIGDGFSAGSSKDLTVVDALPEVCNGLLRNPWCNEFIMVGIEVSRPDQSIGANQVSQHGLQCDHGKAHGVVLEGGKILGVDGFKEEFLELLANVVIEAEGSQLGVVDMIQLCQLEFHQLCLIMERERARVWWCREWHRVGKGNVFCQCHEECKVYVLPCSQICGYSTGICKELLLKQLQGGSHWIANNWHEHWVWKNNVIICHVVQLAASCSWQMKEGSQRSSSMLWVMVSSESWQK